MRGFIRVTMSRRRCDKLVHEPDPRFVRVSSIAAIQAITGLEESESGRSGIYIAGVGYWFVEQALAELEELIQLEVDRAKG